MSKGDPERILSGVWFAASFCAHSTVGGVVCLTFGFVWLALYVREVLRQ